MKVKMIQSEKYWYIQSGYSDNVKNMYYGDDRKQVGSDENKTFRADWFRIPRDSKLYRKIFGEAINHRYVLKDSSFESEKTPLVVMREDFAIKDDYEYNWYPKDEYKDYASLYMEEYDKTEDSFIEEQIEFEIIMEVDDSQISNFKRFRHSAGKNGNYKAYDVTESCFEYNQAYQILIPDLLIHNMPCSISSSDLYNIVREHIKQNINPLVSKITSDYDFCFVVKKLVKKHNPHIWKKEITNNKGKSYRPAKYKEVCQKYNEIEVFNMTSEKDKYQNYNILKGIEAENQEQLIEKIENYLDDLMTKINTPFKECECCKGTGVLEAQDGN